MHQGGKSDTFPVVLENGRGRTPVRREKAYSKTFQQAIKNFRVSELVLVKQPDSSDATGKSLATFAQFNPNFTYYIEPITGDYWFERTLLGCCQDELLSDCSKRILAQRLYSFYCDFVADIAVLNKSKLPSHFILPSHHLLSNALQHSYLYDQGPDFTHKEQTHFEIKLSQDNLENSQVVGENCSKLPEVGLGKILAVAFFLNEPITICNDTSSNVGYQLATSKEGDIYLQSVFLGSYAPFSDNFSVKVIAYANDDPTEEQLAAHRKAGDILLIKKAEKNYYLSYWKAEKDNWVEVKHKLIDLPFGERAQEKLEPLDSEEPILIKDFLVIVQLIFALKNLDSNTFSFTDKYIRLNLIENSLEKEIALSLEDLPKQTAIEYVETLRKIVLTEDSVWMSLFSSRYQNEEEVSKYLYDAPIYRNFLELRKEHIIRFYYQALANYEDYPYDAQAQKRSNVSLNYLSLSEHRFAQRALHNQISDHAVPRYFYDLNGVPTDKKKLTPRRLQDTFKSFIKNANLRIWLLLGPSGSGKSTFLRHLQRILWHEPIYLDKSRKAYRVLFVPLNRYKDKEIGNCIVSCFQTMYFWSQEQIEEEKKQPWLFLLDGYSEVRGHPESNIYQANQLESWPSSKVLISCDSNSALSKESQRFLFAPIPQQDQLLVSHISALTHEQIYSYFDRDESTRTIAENYRPNVLEHNELLQNPLHLYLMASILPKWVAESDSNKQLIEAVSNEVNLTEQHLAKYDENEISQRQSYCLKKGLTISSRSGLYQRYFQQYFTHAQREVDGLSQYTLESLYRIFYKLSLIFFELRATSVSHKDEDFCNLLKNNHLKVFLLKGLLKENQGYYQFFHSSYQDYGVAQAMIFTLLTEDYEQILSAWKLNHITSSNNLVNFLLEIVRTHEKQDDIIKGLWQLVETAKKPRTGYAESNALTLLNYLGFSFNGKLFEKCYLAKTDLSGALLEGACFKEARLVGSNFTGARLAEVSFKKSDMTDTYFGQLKKLVLNDPASDVIYLNSFLNGTLILLNSEGVHLYNQEGKQLKFAEFPHFLKTSDLMVDKIALSFGSTAWIPVFIENAFKLWNSKTGKTKELYQEDKFQEMGVKQYAFSMNFDGGIPNFLVTIALVYDNEPGKLWIYCENRSFFHTISPNSLIACSSDGRLVASQMIDHTLVLWSYLAENPQKSLQNSKVDDIKKLLFSSDNLLLAALAESGIYVWDVASGQCKFTLSSEWVNDITFSPDAQFLAVQYEQKISLWAAASGTYQQTVVTDKKIEVMNITCNNQLLFFSGNLIYYKDISPTMFDSKAFTHAYSVFSSNGKFVCWYDHDPKKGLILENILTGFHKEIKLNSNLFPINNAVFSLDESQLILINQSGVIIHYDIFNEIISLFHFKQNTNLVSQDYKLSPLILAKDLLIAARQSLLLGVRFSKESAQIITLGRDEKPIVHMAFSPDRSILFSMNVRGKITQWDTNGLKPIIVTEVLESPNMNPLLVMRENSNELEVRKIRFLNIEPYTQPSMVCLTGRDKLALYYFKNTQYFRAFITFSGDNGYSLSDRLANFDFSTDAEVLVCLQRGVLRLYHRKEGIHYVFQKEFQSHGNIRQLALTPKGELLAISGREGADCGAIKILSVSTGELLKILYYHHSIARELFFPSEDELVAKCDRSVSIWEKSYQNKEQGDFYLKACSSRYAFFQNTKIADNVIAVSSEVEKFINQHNNLMKTVSQGDDEGSLSELFTKLRSVLG